MAKMLSYKFNESKRDGRPINVQIIYHKEIGNHILRITIFEQVKKEDPFRHIRFYEFAFANVEWPILSRLDAMQIAESNDFKLEYEPLADGERDWLKKAIVRACLNKPFEENGCAKD